MIGSRHRRPAEAFFAILALLCWESGLRSAVLCVHEDGSTAIETGADRCCLPGIKDGRPAAGTSALEASGHCPGCQDTVLSSAAQTSSSSSSMRVVALPAAFAHAEPAAPVVQVANVVAVSSSPPGSPPAPLPLRV